MTRIDLENFFVNLKTRLASAGVSQGQLARQANMKPSQLSALLNAENADPRRSTMVRLVKALDELCQTEAAKWAAVRKEEEEQTIATTRNAVDKTIDLMEALKRSLAKAKVGRSA
jgi:transcriptional regulator with XRE-family HTH domain